MLIMFLVTILSVYDNVHYCTLCLYTYEVRGEYCDEELMIVIVTFMC